MHITLCSIIVLPNVPFDFWNKFTQLCSIPSKYSKVYTELVVVAASEDMEAA